MCVCVCVCVCVVCGCVFIFCVCIYMALYFNTNLLLANPTDVFRCFIMSSFMDLRFLIHHSFGVLDCIEYFCVLIVVLITCNFKIVIFFFFICTLISKFLYVCVGVWCGGLCLYSLYVYVWLYILNTKLFSNPSDVFRCFIMSSFMFY